MKIKYSKDEIKKSLEKLSSKSGVARAMLAKSNIQVTDILDYESYHKESTFHPDGESGSIELNDEYCMGIRCNHLIWVEGCCEDDDDYVNVGAPEEKVLMIMGNHKGFLKIQVIY